MVRTCPLRPGCAYSFLYPRHNYAGLPDRSELRRVRVTSIRDTRREPLDSTTVPLNPTLQRGRWLVTGHDLDRNAERSFYAASMVGTKKLAGDDLEPIHVATAYVVIGDSSRVEHQSERLGEAMAFLLGRRSGVLCGVLSRASIRPPRKTAHKSRKRSRTRTNRTPTETEPDH